jgi:hypothetical protein
MPRRPLLEEDFHPSPSSKEPAVSFVREQAPEVVVEPESLIRELPAPVEPAVNQITDGGKELVDTIF